LDHENAHWTVIEKTIGKEANIGFPLMPGEEYVEGRGDAEGRDRRAGRGKGRKKEMKFFSRVS
jgi:hypothetical protein